mmetsp:Transcript_24279/g.52904  ORF Transcript_24279/g.52904 Transcript_24279/m.52904 type:complete len:437 (-) Transcript_24279:922-2232(-)
MTKKYKQSNLHYCSNNKSTYIYNHPNKPISYHGTMNLTSDEERNPPARLNGIGGLEMLATVAAPEQNLIEKDWMEAKKGIDKEWAKKWYHLRPWLNPNCSRMSPTDQDLAEYQKEAKEERRKLSMCSKEALKQKLLAEIRQNPDWKVLLDNRQLPTNIADLAKILGSPAWVDTVGSSNAEKIAAHLAVGIFLYPHDAWIVSTKDARLSELGIAGYKDIENKMKIRGCYYKIISKCASELWKAMVKRRMEQGLGWYIGARKADINQTREDGSSGSRAVTTAYTRIETFTGCKAYLVKKVHVQGQRFAAGNTIDPDLDRVRECIQGHVASGGTLAQVQAILDELRDTEQITTSAATAQAAGPSTSTSTVGDRGLGEEDAGAYSPDRRGATGSAEQAGTPRQDITQSRIGAALREEPPMPPLPGRHCLDRQCRLLNRHR